jgi:hypothetical protein
MPPAGQFVSRRLLVPRQEPSVEETIELGVLGEPEVRSRLLPELHDGNRFCRCVVCRGEAFLKNGKIREHQRLRPG